MWRVGGMQRASMLVKAAVQLRAAKPAALKMSLVAPMLAQYSLPKVAVRAGGITVLSTFSAMALRSSCMNIFEEEVDMDFLDGNESVASAAEEHAASAAEESEALAAEESEALAAEESEAAVEDGNAAAHDSNQGTYAQTISERSSEGGSEGGSERGSDHGSECGSSRGCDRNSDPGSDNDFDDDVEDDYPEPAAERVAAGTLEVGKEAEHDHLGMGTVLACARSKEVAHGVDVVFADYHDGKVLFSFVKRVKKGRSWVPQTVERWVCEDNLTARMSNDGEGNVSTEAGPSGTSAFDEMQESARANRVLRNTFMGRSPKKRGFSGLF
jgi:hypothetical protein